MTTPNFLNGKQASVKIGEVVYRFKTLNLEFETPSVNANNFDSPSQVVVAGVDKGTLTLDGPYDAGNMPFTTGTTYDFIVDADSAGTYTWTVPFYVEKVAIKDDVDDMARITLNGTSNGDITPSVT